MIDVQTFTFQCFGQQIVNGRHRFFGILFQFLGRHEQPTWWTFSRFYQTRKVHFVEIVIFDCLPGEWLREFWLDKSYGSEDSGCLVVGLALDWRHEITIRISEPT